MFLHGIPGSALTWEAVATRMQEQYRVIVPDLRGFGQSEPPVGDYYMEGQARALKELLDALGTGHFVPEERPEEVASAILDFLQF